jgi:antitoxin VapB
MKTASLFMNGRSQAVRLPAEFRFASKQVFIYKDERTGNVVLSEAPPSSSWGKFMNLRAEVGLIAFDNQQVTDLSAREQASQFRDPFEGWVE